MASIARPCPLELDAVAHALTVFINTSIMARGRPVRPDDNREAAGVDSMAPRKGLLFIEAECGFRMPDEDRVEDNIASSRVLARSVCRHTGAAA